MNLSLDTDRDDWTRSLRLRIGTLPADPGPGDIENLLDRLTPVAWLAGCPDTRSLDLATCRGATGAISSPAAATTATRPC